jgi:multidrug efflux pump subunit AcrB
MLSSLINKNIMLIDNNQNDISLMKSQYGGNDMSDSGNRQDEQYNQSQQDQYKQLKEYEENRDLFKRLKDDLHNQVNRINSIIGGNIITGNNNDINIGDIFLEEENNEKNNYKRLQKNMIQQQNILIKTGGGKSNPRYNIKKDMLKKEFKIRINDGNKQIKKLYDLHKKTKKILEKKYKETAKAAKQDNNNIEIARPHDIHKKLLSNIKNITQKIYLSN